MRIWITGGGGFIGHHLTKLALEKGNEVFSNYYPDSEKNKKISGNIFTKVVMLGIKKEFITY